MLAGQPPTTEAPARDTSAICEQLSSPVDARRRKQMAVLSVAGHGRVSLGCFRQLLLVDQAMTTDPAIESVFLEQTRCGQRRRSVFEQWADNRLMMFEDHAHAIGGVKRMQSNDQSRLLVVASGGGEAEAGRCDRRQARLDAESPRCSPQRLPPSAVRKTGHRQYRPCCSGR